MKWDTAPGLHMEHIVKKNIIIRATPEQVWDALTNPEKTRQYFFNCRVHSTWEVETPIIFTGRIFLFKKIELKGEIVRIEPKKYLKYTLENTSNPSDVATTSVVSWLLSFYNGKTTVFISDDVGIGKGMEKRYKRSIKGWDKILRGLKKLVESRK